MIKATAKNSVILFFNTIFHYSNINLNRNILAVTPDFFIVFYKEYLVSYKTFILFVLNILLSLPAIYYLFILDIFFISTGGLSYNISNKILVISSIIFFYLFPFLIIIFRSNKIEISFKKLFIFFIFYLIAYYYLILNFNYDLNSAGGGFFLHLSNYLYNSNNIFFFFRHLCFKLSILLF